MSAHLQEASGLLRGEVVALLDSLSGTAAFREMLRQPLAQRGRCLSDTSELRWSLLPLLVCESICGRYDHAVPAAAAIELFKAAGDVFDDIEDRDSPSSLAEIYGEEQAINAANALVLLGYRAVLRLRETGVNSETVLSVVEALSSSGIRACAGQHHDLLSDSQNEVSEDSYFETVALKSASQLECACRVGALLATEEQELIDLFATFGHNLGMAAQIVNDIHDITAPAGGGRDIAKGKKTLPLIFALAHAEGADRELLRSIRDVPDVQGIRLLLLRIGAVHYAATVVELYRVRASKALGEVENAGAGVEQLKGMLGA